MIAVALIAFLFVLPGASLAADQHLECITRAQGNADPALYPGRQVRIHCDSGYVATGGGAACYSSGNWFGRLTKSYPVENGWAATCHRFDTNGVDDNDGAQIVSSIWVVCCRRKLNDSDTEQCSPGTFTLDNKTFSSGRHRYSAEEKLTVAGSVLVQHGATLILTAPTVAFEPGFSVEDAAILSAAADTVTCSGYEPPSPVGASDSPLADTRKINGNSSKDAAPLAHQLINGSRTIPKWLELRLRTLGIDVETLTAGILDTNERWVVLETPQALVSGDGNSESDLFHIDLVAEQITLASATPHGRSGNAASHYPAVDASGELIVFQSAADDLVPDDSNGVTDIFLRDLGLEQTRRLTQSEHSSAHPALDAFAETVVYDQRSSSGQRRILAEWLQGGSGLEALSLDRSISGSLADNHHPSISANGRYVAYLEEAASVGRDTSSCQVHIYDRSTEVYHRQPCPEALAASTEAARAAFSAGAEVLRWQVPGRVAPITLTNPLHR